MPQENYDGCHQGQAPEGYRGNDFEKTNGNRPKLVLTKKMNTEKQAALKS